MELTIVIVFDDYRVLASGPFEEGKSSSQRKNRAGWKLVRWRNENQTGIRRQVSGIQAVAIDRQGQQASASSAKHFPYAVIMAILDCNAAARLDRYACNKIERLLRTVDNNYLRRVADHRTRAAYLPILPSVARGQGLRSNHLSP